MTDGVTPRTLVRYTLYDFDQTVDHVAYEAVQPNGTIGPMKRCDRTVIGYIEVEPYTNIGRYTDFEAFRDRLEEAAEYLHFKPKHNGQIGSGDCWAEAHELIQDGEAE